MGNDIKKQDKRVQGPAGRSDADKRPAPTADDRKPSTGGDQDIDTVGTDADDSDDTLEQHIADSADEAGSAFLPHDKVLDRKKH